RPGNTSWLDGREAVASFRIGQTATEAAESRFDRFVLRVFRMRVFALRIGLPDLDDGIVDGFAVAVDDAAGERDSFAGHARGSELDDRKRLEADLDVRTDGLGRSGEQTHRVVSSCARFPSVSRHGRAARHRSGR